MTVQTINIKRCAKGNNGFNFRISGLNCYCSTILSRFNAIFRNILFFCYCFRAYFNGTIFVNI